MIISIFIILLYILNIASVIMQAYFYLCMKHLEHTPYASLQPYLGTLKHKG